MYKSKSLTTMGILVVFVFVAGTSGLARALIDGLTGEAVAVPIRPRALGCHNHVGEGIHCDKNLED